MSKQSRFAPWLVIYMPVKDEDDDAVEWNVTKPVVKQAIRAEAAAQMAIKEDLTGVRLGSSDRILVVGPMDAGDANIGAQLFLLRPPVGWTLEAIPNA